MAECFCDINAYALKGLCECEETCTCDCEVCQCAIIDLWSVDLVSACPCGGNCSCEKALDEVQ